MEEGTWEVKVPTSSERGERHGDVIIGVTYSGKDYKYENLGRGFRHRGKTQDRRYDLLG